jgi:hypothetical protein
MDNAIIEVRERRRIPFYELNALRRKFGKELNELRRGKGFFSIDEFACEINRMHGSREPVVSGNTIRKLEAGIMIKEAATVAALRMIAETLGVGLFVGSDHRGSLFDAETTLEELLRMGTVLYFEEL